MSDALAYEKKNFSSDTGMMKKLDHNASSSQKWMDM